MTEDLQKIVEHENDFWSKIFESELKADRMERFSSYWWQCYYEELKVFVDQFLQKNQLTRILEAGSGSGKATILLDRSFSKTLLDISSVALQYASHLSKKFESDGIEFVEGDLYKMPFKSGEFDFVWNIGVIEHYSLENIELILEEMFRVCRSGGAVAVGMPNFYSGPIVKAWFLKKIKFLPGYKLDTERFYKIEEIVRIFHKVSSGAGKQIDVVSVERFGNPLIMETPKFILNSIGNFVAKIFGRNKFLILIVCKFN